MWCDAIHQPFAAAKKLLIARLSVEALSPTHAQHPRCCRRPWHSCPGREVGRYIHALPPLRCRLRHRLDTAPHPQAQGQGAAHEEGGADDPSYSIGRQRHWMIRWPSGRPYTTYASHVGSSAARQDYHAAIAASAPILPLTSSVQNSPVNLRASSSTTDHNVLTKIPAPPLKEGLGETADFGQLIRATANLTGVQKHQRTIAVPHATPARWRAWQLSSSVPDHHRNGQLRSVHICLKAIIAG